MALAHRITTLERLTAFLPSARARLEGEDRERATMLIDAATVAIERYMERPVIVREFAERYSGGINGHRGGARQLFLRRYPVVAVGSIVDDDANAVAADDYRLDTERGILEYRGGGLEGAARHGACWPAPVGAWTITYTAGLAADTDAVETQVPDIELACLMATRDLWRGGPPATISKSSGQKSESYMAPKAALSDEVRSLLDPYAVRSYH